MSENKNKANKQKLPDIKVSIGADKPPTPSKQVNLVGQEISINLKQTTFWGIGPIWLSYKNYWCKVPAGLTDQEYAIVANGLRNGDLVLGKKLIPIVDKNEDVLDEYWMAIRDAGFTKDATEKFMKLLKAGVDRGFNPIEIAKHCTDKEMAYKKRKPVLRTLDEIHKRYGGYLEPYDPPDDEQGIKKVIIKDGVVTKYLNGEVVQNSDQLSNEQTKETSPEAKQALDNLFK